MDKRTSKAASQMKQNVQCGHMHDYFGRIHSYEKRHSMYMLLIHCTLLNSALDGYIFNYDTSACVVQLAYIMVFVINDD